MHQSPVKDSTCCDKTSDTLYTESDSQTTSCCDSDMCSNNQSHKDPPCYDSDNERQPSDDIEIDEDTFQKGDQYSRQIKGGPSASMMSVEDPEAFAEIVCLAPGEGEKPLYIFTDEHFESMSTQPNIHGNVSSCVPRTGGYGAVYGPGTTCTTHVMHTG